MKSITNAFDVSLRSIISMAEKNQSFLKIQILNELKRCFPIDAINPYYKEISSFDLSDDSNELNALFPILVTYSSISIL